MEAQTNQPPSDAGAATRTVPTSENLMTIIETKERCRAEFRCHAPSATAVYLAGSFNNWDYVATPLSREGDGNWAVVLDLPPGFYPYKFVVDGRWCCEFGQTNQSAACAACGCTGDRCVPNVYGTMDRVRIVG